MFLVQLILTFVLLHALVKGLELLLRKTSADRVLLTRVGLGWLFLLLVYAMEVCQVAGLIWIWKPYPAGHWLALGAVGLVLLQRFLVWGVLLCKPEAVREAMRASLEARGLPVSDGALKLMTRPRMHLVPLAYGVVFTALWCAMVFVIKGAR